MANIQHLKQPASIAENLDRKTVSGFGEEWSAYDQSDLSDTERRELFDDYFSVFPWASLPPQAEGFDMGCGSGRWALSVAPKVGLLNCVDASGEALDVARMNLAGVANVRFHHASVGNWNIEDGSQDFGYSLGVLHHVPDTAAAIRACTAKLKTGAPLLLYLYYRFDNKPLYFRLIWRLSDLFRSVICRLPFIFRRSVTEIIAALVYFPLARLALLVERTGASVANWPLSAYRDKSFYTMRTDALDRFGTRLEQRFTRAEIAALMRSAGLRDITFRDGVPYWVAVGYKSGA